MARELTQHPATPNHLTIRPPVAAQPRALAKGQGTIAGIPVAASMAISVVIAAGLLLSVGARAQPSDDRTVDRTGDRTESHAERRSDGVMDTKRIGIPMDHHRPGWRLQGDGPRHPRMGWMLDRVDTDRDGAISRAELEAEHQRQVALFEEADSDHDGKVTTAERRAFHGRHWKERHTERHPQGRPAPAPPLESPARSSQGGEPAR